MNHFFGRQQSGRTAGRVVLWLCCMLAVICPVLLHAQEFRGTLMGQVTDATGAVVPGASVVAVGPQQTYKATTSDKGDFTIPFVQPGAYNITIEAAGFKKVARQGVIVNVSDKLNLTFALEVGAVSDTITVSAEQIQVNTADASGGMVIDPQQVASLPMNGRQMYSLLSLTPGAKVSNAGQSTRGGWDETNSTSFNGQWGNYTQFALNGAPVSQQNGGGAGTWNISPAVDAVEEFKVMTNTYDAQYGRTNGGTVNTILKSGTNKYHGTLSDFWRNSALDANYYDLNQQGVKKQFHNEHQFGGTFGGPVPKLGKNTFFFFSYEGYRQIIPKNIVTTTITPDMLPDANGNINLGPYLAATNRGNIYDPTTTTCVAQGQNGCSTYGRDQFANNTIPAARISPIGLNILKLLPLANRPGYVDNYVTSNPGRTNYNQPIVRIDHNFGDNTRIYGMFAWWSGNEYSNTNGFPGAAAMGNINNYKSSLTQVVDATHTFKANLFADLRMSYNRMYNMSPDGSVSGGLVDLTATSLGLNMPSIPTTSHDFAPEFHSDDSAIGNGNYSYGNNWVGNTVGPTIFETYDIAPSLTHIVGKHNLHYGAQISWYHDIPNGIRRPNGGFNFGPGWTQENPYQGANDGSTIASMLLGYPSWGGVEYNLATYESYKDYAGYVQDDWKLRKNVTLNLGVRYENEMSPMDRWGRLQAGLCLTCKNPFQPNYSIFPNNTLPNGFQLPSDLMGGMMFQKDRSPYQNTWGIMLPKVGVSVGLTDKLVLRGGWGMYRALGFELGGTSTFDANTDYATSLDGGLTPNTAFNTGTPFSSGARVPVGDTLGMMSGVGDGIWYDSWERKIPYTHQFSFGFQGEAPGKIIWDVEYVGARTFDLRAGMQHDHLTPEQFAKGHADPSYLDQMVANPFYGQPGIAPSSYLGSHQQLHAYELMVPFPQYDSGCCGPEVWEWNTPQGYSHYDSLVAKAEKRLSGGGLLSKGLSFTTAFTWSKLMSATGRLNNGLLTDPQPTYGIDGSDRPITFSFAGVYELPIGKGGIVARDAKGVLGQVINNWQLNWIIYDQSGTPVGYPNGYSYTCDGTFNAKPSSSSWNSYLNNSNPGCFANFPQYTAITQYGQTTAVRTPWAEQTQVALQKQFAITEGTKLQFRAEAFNLTNTPMFYGPDTGSPDRAIHRNSNILDGQPGAYSGYGTIGSRQANRPRELQLSLKVLF